MHNDDAAVLSHVARRAGRLELMNHAAFFLVLGGLITSRPSLIAAMVAMSATSIVLQAIHSNMEGAKLRREFESMADPRSSVMAELGNKIDFLGRPLFKPAFTHPLNVGLSAVFTLVGGISMLALTVPTILMATENIRLKHVNETVRRLQNNNPR